MYVSGEPGDIADRIETLACEAADAGDLDAVDLYSTPGGARAATIKIAKHILA